MNDVRVVVRLRTLGSTGINPIQSEVIDRLRTLGDTDPITEFDIDAWGPSMGSTLSGGRDPTGTRETVTEFERWAHEHGCTLRPAFDRRGTESGSNDEEIRRGGIVLPLLCLAIYDGEALRAVYPHVDGEEVYTIHDGVDTLESLVVRDERLDSEDESREEATASLP